MLPQTWIEVAFVAIFWAIFFSLWEYIRIFVCSLNNRRYPTIQRSLLVGVPRGLGGYFCIFLAQSGIFPLFAVLSTAGFVWLWPRFTRNQKQNQSEVKATTSSTDSITQMTSEDALERFCSQLCISEAQRSQLFLEELRIPKGLVMGALDELGENLNLPISGDDRSQFPTVAALSSYLE